jgi:hypothetical protein
MVIAIPKLKREVLSMRFLAMGEDTGAAPMPPQQVAQMLDTSLCRAWRCWQNGSAKAESTEEVSRGDGVFA